MQDTIGHVLGGIGLLIFAFLILNNWKGANSLLGTGLNSGNSVIKTLQGR
jgi:hypothetical protein